MSHLEFIIHSNLCLGTSSKPPQRKGDVIFSWTWYSSYQLQKNVRSAISLILFRTMWIFECKENASSEVREPCKEKTEIICGEIYNPPSKKPYKIVEKPK